MANEIRVVGQLQIAKDGFTVNGNITQNITLTGSQYGGSIINVGTAYEALPTTDYSDFRYIFIENQSTASISVTLHANSQSFAVLRPDDVIILPPSGSWMNYYVKSTEAGADIKCIATEA